MTNTIIDVVIVGCGPAGLQAAIHAARKKATVVVLGKPETSSLYSAHVENYLCVDGVSSGADMLLVGSAQARRFGVNIVPHDVLSIAQKDDFYEIAIADGSTLVSRTLILATGTSRKKLRVPGEKELMGRGVSYCVDCDANFFRNAKVAVVGDGSAAVDGALTLLNYASDVFLVAENLVVSDALLRRLNESQVQTVMGSKIREIQGDNAVIGVLLENHETIEVEGVFIELGSKGAVELATNLGVMLDSETFTHIATDKKQQTNLAGVYAAGDIAGRPYQMAKAVGEGCVAGWEAANYSRKMKKSAE